MDDIGEYNITVAYTTTYNSPVQSIFINITFYVSIVCTPIINYQYNGLLYYIYRVNEGVKYLDISSLNITN